MDFTSVLEHTFRVAKSSTQAVQNYPGGICIHNVLLRPCESGKEVLQCENRKGTGFWTESHSKNQAVLFLLFVRQTMH